MSISPEDVKTIVGRAIGGAATAAYCTMASGKSSERKASISPEDVKMIVGRAVGGPAAAAAYSMASGKSSERKMSISPEEVKLIVGGQVDVVEHKLREFSNDKTGFTSTHKYLEVSLKRQLKPDDELVTQRLGFFAKFPPQGPPVLLKAIDRLQGCKKEVEYFEQVAPRLQTYAPNTLPWAPRCYLAREDVLVLEDMSEKGFAVDRKDILFSEEKLKAAARAQARLHAASYVTESILIKERGKSFKDLAPTACEERIFDKTSEYLELKKSMPLEWLGRVQAAGDNARNCDHELLARSQDRVYDWLYFENGKNNVICHGDTWAFNMMFDKSEPPNCRLLDFQLTRYGPRAFDLAQMTYFTTTREMRAKYEAATVEAYHLEFCETLRKNGFEPISTLAELQEEYEEARLAALFASAIYYPFLWLDEQAHRSFESPEELYTKFIYRQNNDAVYALMERDERYRQTLTQLALELLDECEKVDAKLNKESQTDAY